MECNMEIIKGGVTAAKGFCAAGQAVQNMNLLFGLPETEGLMAAPMFP